ncbi:MAG: DUF1499 domain-containing protein [Candidatus Binatia bacterium]
MIKLIVIFMLSGCSARPPVIPGQGAIPSLRCPSTPNCVSSYMVDTRHYVAPLRYAGDLDTAKKRLIAAIRSLNRSRIVATEGLSIRAEFTSAFFGFIDDVEIFFDDTAKVIHVKSASRVGYFDFGVNRTRVERLRERFVALQTHTPE